MRTCIPVGVKVKSLRDWNYHFFSGDIHIGHRYFDENLFMSEFEEAKELGAHIYINGDVLEMISTKDLKRYQPENDKYKHSGYCNHIVRDAVKLLKPYVNNIVMIGCGNHEVEFQKRHNIDIISFLIGSLQEYRNHDLPPIYHGGYAGFIKISYKTENTRWRSYDVYYNHGQGGKSEVTKGLIDINRYFNHKFVDLLWLAHKHNKFVLPSEPIDYVDRSGVIKTKNRWGIMTGCYKHPEIQDIPPNQEYSISYADEKSRSRESLGGIFMKQKLTLTKVGEIRGKKIITKFIC